MDSSKQDKAKPKNKEDEIDEQKNKGHRGLNKKLKKRRKQEKETKKEKKLKKKEYQDKREKYREQYFQQGDKVKSKSEKDSKGIKITKLKKAVYKFLEVYEDEIDDMKSIFASLDNNEEIEIDDIENKTIKKQLKKIFKYLKLRQKTGKTGYVKTAKTQFSLNSYMNTIINDQLLSLSEKQTNKTLKDDNNSNSDKDDSDSHETDNDSDEDGGKSKNKHKGRESDSEDEEDGDEDDDDDSDSEELKQKPKKKLKKDSSDEEEEHKDKKQVEKSKTQPRPQVLGPSLPSAGLPSLISASEKEQFLNNSIPNAKSTGSDWVVGGDLDQFLNDQFKEVESSNIKKYLQNRKVPQNNNANQPQLSSSRMAEGSAPLNLENVIIGEEEDAILARGNEYEQKYRNKSLMEIHQENMKKKKEENKNQPLERKPFNRDNDLIKKTDSKKIFAALKDSFHLGPKFLPSKQ